MVNVVYPRDASSLKDAKVQDTANSISVFLAGTIDSGNSVDWQQEFIDYLNMKYPDVNFIAYNPRRKIFGDLDKNELEYQIKWELSHLKSCDIIFMNILGSSKSPITLLELGCFKNKNLIVNCPPEFYRYENVKVTSEVFNIHHTDDIADAKIIFDAYVKKYIQ